MAARVGRQRGEQIIAPAAGCAGQLAARQRLWLRGGFLRAFLANNEADSLIWRRDFIRTLLESDLPQLGKRVPAVTLQRFWAMLAHGPGPWSWAAMERRRTAGPFPRDQPNHRPP
ncbi:MAG: hypothetical protein ACKN89_07450 [Cyanobium sp.]